MSDGETKRLSIFFDCRRVPKDNANYGAFRQATYNECSQLLSLAVVHRLLSLQLRLILYLITEKEVIRVERPLDSVAQRKTYESTTTDINVDLGTADEITFKQSNVDLAGTNGRHMWGYHPAFATLLELVGVKSMAFAPCNLSETSVFTNRFDLALEHIREALIYGPPHHLVLVCSVFVSPVEVTQRLSTSFEGSPNKQICCILPEMSTARLTKARINPLLRLYRCSFIASQMQCALQDVLSPFVLPGMTQTRRIVLQADDFALPLKAILPHFAESIRRCCRVSDVSFDFAQHHGGYFAGPFVQKCLTEKGRHDTLMEQNEILPCVLTLVGMVPPREVDEAFLFGDTWLLTWDDSVGDFEAPAQLRTFPPVCSHFRTFCGVFKDSVLVLKGDLRGLASPCYVAMLHHYYAAYVCADNTMRLREIVPAELRFAPMMLPLSTRTDGASQQENSTLRAKMEDCRHRLTHCEQPPVPWLMRLQADVMSLAASIDPNQVQGPVSFTAPQVQ